MSSKYEHYSMVIQWSMKNEAYQVTVPELPECKAYGATYEEAVKQGQDAIKNWIDASIARDDSIPSPRLYVSE